MHRSPAACAVIFALLLSFIFAGCAKTETVKADIPLVRSEVIKTDALGPSASYSGEVRGRYETQLAFQVSGKIIKRYVEPGSVINSGDVLMEIDARDIRQTVNISSAQVSSAQAQLTLAQNNLERYRALYEQGAVSRAQLDQYQNSYEVALAAVRQTSAQYAQGANQLSYSTLVADSAGVIAAVNAETGQVVSAGQPVITLVSGGERDIEISVPESRIEEIRSGRQVRVSFWALPGIIAEGKVREISPVADKVSRTYKVRVSLVNPPHGVNLGMTASVSVLGTAGHGTVYIPLTALYQTGDTPNVWVIQEGAAILRPVKVGSFGDGRIQVLEGLQEGDVIVTAGVQKLREGQKVRL